MTFDPDYMTFDDCDFWYDWGKFDASRGRESAAHLIRIFDGLDCAACYLEGFYDAALSRKG